MAEGELFLSQSKLRLDLSEKSTQSRDLLILGEKKFWAVHYPPKELIGAAIQVIQGDFQRQPSGHASGKAESRKLPKKKPNSAQSGLLALFGTGGLLKSFTVTGVQVEKTGNIRYYLMPKTEWVEAKRAMVEMAEEGQTVSLSKVLIWDFQDNESEYILRRFEVVAKKQKLRPGRGQPEASDSKPELSAKQIAEKFKFSVPDGADVMTVD